MPARSICPKLLCCLILAVALIGCTRKPGRYSVRHSYVPHTRLATISDSLSLPYQPSGYSLYLPSQKSNIAAALVFFGDVPVDSLRTPEEVAVVQPAIAKNVAVGFVATGKPLDLLENDTALRRLDSIMEQMIVANGLPRHKIVFAGLSLSGTRAMRYAIWCQQNKSAFAVRPAALVLCDAPIDMMRMYDEHKKALQRNFDPLAAGTAVMVVPYLERLFGSPHENRKKYIAYSPYSYADSLGGNARYLGNLPVRAYHEPDINWWIRYRRKDYYSMNSLDLAGLINQLLLAGNTRAELVTSHRQSVGAAESPHSWRIVDNRELVDWLLGL